jgi:KUP system potassium uptake protein
MEEEISMIQKNCTWELVDRPLEKNIIGVKWVFRTKLNADSSIKNIKSGWLLRGLLRYLVLIIQIFLLL